MIQILQSTAEQSCGHVLIRSCSRLLILDGLILASFLIMSSVVVTTAPEPPSSPVWSFCSWSLWMLWWSWGRIFNCLWLDGWWGLGTTMNRKWLHRMGLVDADETLAHVSLRRKLKITIMYGALALDANMKMLIRAQTAYILLRRIIINNMLDDDLQRISPSEKVMKIIASCKVVVGTSAGKIPATHGRTLGADSVEMLMDEDCALVLGRNNFTENSYMVQLNCKGKEALLRSGVLPGYERLRLLRGKYGSLVMVLAGVQSSGYILAVIIRALVGCDLSVIEFPGSLLSATVVIYSIHHFVFLACPRSLILHLNPGKEQDTVSALCNATEWSYDEYDEMAKRRCHTWDIFEWFLSFAGVALLLPTISRAIISWVSPADRTLQAHQMTSN